MNTMTIEQVSSASTKELVAFYNEHAEVLGKKQIVKFADRMTAEIRVKTMIEDLIAMAEENEVEVSLPSVLSVSLGLAPAPYVTEGMKVRAAVAKSLAEDTLEATESWNNYEDLHDGAHKCPHCGIDLSNGVGVHNDEVNGKKIKHEEREYCCLACGEEFGPKIKKAVKKPVVSTGEAREAMVTSLKLDRTITATDSNGVVLGTWANACRMWKQNLDWMTSAQQDTLTAKLYKAAKAGEKIVVTINGRNFQLVNV